MSDDPHVQCYIDTAEGEALERIGALMGVYRFGRTDEELRAACERSTRGVMPTPTCAIAVGDKVHVIGGPYRGCSGTVDGYQGPTAAIDLGAGRRVLVDPQHCHVVTSAPMPAETPPEHECPVCSLDASTCGHVPCTACAGTGGAPCSDCRGTGTYVGMHEIATCRTCAGAGKIVCEPCGGSGW